MLYTFLYYNAYLTCTHIFRSVYKHQCCPVWSSQMSIKL